MNKIKSPLKAIILLPSPDKPELITIPENVFGLSKSELFAIRNSVPPFKLKSSTSPFKLGPIHKRKIGQSISDMAFCWPSVYNGLNYLHVVDIENPLTSIHIVIPNVLNWLTTRYAIGFIMTSDPGTQNQIGILKSEPGIPSLIEAV